MTASLHTLNTLLADVQQPNATATQLENTFLYAFRETSNQQTNSEQNRWLLDKIVTTVLRHPQCNVEQCLDKAFQYIETRSLTDSQSEHLKHAVNDLVHRFSEVQPIFVTKSDLLNKLQVKRLAATDTPNITPSVKP